MVKSNQETVQACLLRVSLAVSLSNPLYIRMFIYSTHFSFLPNIMSQFAFSAIYNRPCWGDIEACCQGDRRPQEVCAFEHCCQLDNAFCCLYVVKEVVAFVPCAIQLLKYLFKSLNC
jgi:hypothetical protein